MFMYINPSSFCGRLSLVRLLGVYDFEPDTVFAPMPARTAERTGLERLLLSIASIILLIIIITTIAIITIAIIIICVM